MIDRKKFAIIIASAVVLVALVIAVIAVVMSNQQIVDRPTSSPTAVEVPDDVDPVETPTPEPSPTFPEETKKLQELYMTEYAPVAIRVVNAAATWSSSQTPEERVQAYREAGMSDELAESFAPIWADMFTDAAVTDVEAQIVTFKQIGEITGSEGAAVWNVMYDVTFQANWNVDGAGSRLARESAYWWVTVDQATGKVTGISQPDPATLNIGAQ